MSAFDPGEYTGFLLRRTQELHASLWAKEVSVTVTPVQYGIMEIVANQAGIDQATLSRSLGLDKSTIALVVLRLVDRGLLVRHRSSRDRRRYSLLVPPSGLALLETVRRPAQRVDNLFAESYLDGRRAELDGLLRGAVERANSLNESADP